jgi:hypothetical protein
MSRFGICSGNLNEKKFSPDLKTRRVMLPSPRGIAGDQAADRLTWV